MMSQPPVSIIKQLRSALIEGHKNLAKTAGLAEKLMSKGPAALVGTFCSLVGISIAYALSLIYPFINFEIAGTLGSGIGLVGGLLAFWGPRSFREERNRQNKARRIDFLLQEYNKLPRTAPIELKQQFWNAYQIEMFGRVAEPLPGIAKPTATPRLGPPGGQAPP